MVTNQQTLPTEAARLTKGKATGETPSSLEQALGDKAVGAMLGWESASASSLSPLSSSVTRSLDSHDIGYTSASCGGGPPLPPLQVAAISKEAKNPPQVKYQ